MISYEYPIHSRLHTIAESWHVVGDRWESMCIRFEDDESISLFFWWHEDRTRRIHEREEGIVFQKTMKYHAVHDIETLDELAEWGRVRCVLVLPYDMKVSIGWKWRSYRGEGSNRMIGTLYRREASEKEKIMGLHWKVDPLYRSDLRRILDDSDIFFPVSECSRELISGRAWYRDASDMPIEPEEESVDTSCSLTDNPWMLSELSIADMVHEEE